MAAKYSIGDDGLIVEEVGAWTKKKHKILTDYVQAAGATRRKYLRNGAAYVDLFCGPGRALIKTPREFIDGSAVAAFKQATAPKSLAPFSSIEISDGRSDLMAACDGRLRSLGAPVRTAVGPATSSIREIVSRLNRKGLHFAFLDPNNLGALTFSLFEELAHLEYVDVLVHVSVADIRRNTDRYSSADYDQFDVFAPGWQNAVKTDTNQKAIRSGVINFWSDKVKEIGLPRAKHCELITGDQQQELYWLIFLSGAPFAHALWEKISSYAKAPTFDFDR
jgi:three-Cys-motif partner protein